MASYILLISEEPSKPTTTHAHRQEDHKDSLDFEELMTHLSCGHRDRFSQNLQYISKV